MGVRNKMSIAPHAHNIRFNINKVKRCGAYARQTGKPCKQPAMTNGRCRLHGGKSTGAKTDKGRRKARLANYRNGNYTNSKKHYHHQINGLIKGSIETMLGINQ